MDANAIQPPIIGYKYEGKLFAKLQEHLVFSISTGGEVVVSDDHGNSSIKHFWRKGDRATFVKKTFRPFNSGKLLLIF